MGGRWDYIMLLHGLFTTHTIPEKDYLGTNYQNVTKILDSMGRNIFSVSVLYTF